MIKKIINSLLNVILAILSVVLVIMLVLRFGFIKVEVHGSSMNPGIVNGDFGYMVKVDKNTKIERFDVVASGYDDKDYYIIKRVLGLPNEEITIKSNLLFVNGELIEQNFNFVSSATNFKTTSWTLGDDEYLLVGDNRPITVEPAVEKKSEIIGKNGFCYKLSSDVESTKLWYKFKDGR